MANSNSQQENFLGTIASIALPLLQLVAVSSASLSDQIKISAYFLRPELLPIINFLVIFIVLSFIGIAVLKQNLSPFSTNWGKFRLFFWRKTEPNYFRNEKQQQILSLPFVYYLLQLPSFITLICLIFLDLNLTTQVKTFIQYLSYVIFFSSSGIILYYWVQTYFERKKEPRESDFIPLLTESLREVRLLGEDKVEILGIANLDHIRKAVRVKIESKTEYFLIADYYGRAVYNVWDISNAPTWVKEIVENAYRPQRNNQ